MRIKKNNLGVGFESLAEQLHLLYFSLVMGFVFCFFAWKNGFFHFPYPEVKKKPLLRLRDLVGAFALFLALQVLLIPALAVLYLYLTNGSMKSLVTQGWVNVFGVVSSSAMIILYARYVIPHSRSAIWRENAFAGIRKRVYDFLFGVMMWIISFPVVFAFGQIIAIVLTILFNIQPVEQVAVRYLRVAWTNPTLFWVMAAVIILVVPILEEILFRGFLQTWFKERIGRNLAIVVASVIFSLFHFSFTQGVHNVQILSVLFLLSCFLGFVYERQNSLFAPIGLHVFFNMGSVLLITLEP